MSSPLKRFLFIKKNLVLKKSQMSLFDWQPSHEEMRAREAHQRHLKTGTVVNVAATQARTRVKDEKAIPSGSKVYYKTPDMDRKKKGTIISGDRYTGYKIKPNREGYQLNPAPVHALREHIWTHQEHDFKLIKRKPVTADTSIQRKEEGTAKIGMSEADILQHPTFVKPMKQTLRHLAARNGFNPNYVEHQGVLKNDDPQANELYSEYIMASMGAFRSASSKATPEDISEFNNHIGGTSAQSNIMASMLRSGETAAKRHLMRNNTRLISEQSYDSSMEDDMESGMRAVAAKGAVQHASVTAETSREALEQAIDKMIGNEHPVDAAILKMKFGLANLTHGYKEQDIAASLNKRNIPAPSGQDRWTAEGVKSRLQAALVRLAKEKNVQHLRDFLKSLREHTTTPLQKAMQLFERHLLIKSHIKEYTRQDGTVVQAHDDKRMKHNHVAMHELDHNEQVHTGAKLKHGQELIDHLKNKGWKHKEVSAVRRNEELKVGSKADMPKPHEVKGANKENSALVSAQNVINKMHEAAKKHDDPVTYLKHVQTSRSNPYLKAAGDYRTALLNHFGHDVDHDTKDQRLEKDGHAVVLSGKDGNHTVEHAGYEDKGEKDNSVNPAKDTLTQAIAKIGGMHAGEAKRQFDLTGKDFPAIKGSLKKDGLDPDKVAEILSQHGYIKTDEHGKHDYDDFQDKLRRAATGEKVYSVQRDAKDQEDELAQQEKEYIGSRGIDDPSSEAQGFDDLHPEMQKEYKSVFEEALDVLGKEATNKLIAMYQHDVPFNVKDYVDAQLRRHIDESKGHGKQGDDSEAGKQGTTGGSGQAAAVDSTDDTGKGATRPSPVRKSHREERAGSCLRAYAYVLRKSYVSGYTTHTGRRVDGYCRHCGDGAIFDYKTDVHDDGTKHSYKECRNCGDKIPVIKRMTKQKKERAERQDRLDHLMQELLVGKDLTKALCLLRKAQ